jgi:hypothetical protein
MDKEPKKKIKSTQRRRAKGLENKNLENYFRKGPIFLLSCQTETAKKKGQPRGQSPLNTQAPPKGAKGE